MPWLWFLAPLLAGLIFMLTGQVDKRALQEIDAWREALAKRRRVAPEKEPEVQKQPGNKEKTAYRELAEVPKEKPAKKPKKKPKKGLGPKKILGLSPGLRRLADLAGGGRVLGDYEVVPKVATATFVMGDLAGSSDHQTILIELSEKAPSFSAHPLPYLDGVPTPNTGIEFSKHPEFGAAYLVDGEASQAKAIGKWLTKTLRDTLLDAPNVWLRVEGKLLALSIYGSIRQDKIETLMEVADVFVAEHGAEGGPSLFGEDEDLRGGRNEEEDEDEEEEDEEPANAKK